MSIKENADAAAWAKKTLSADEALLTGTPALAALFAALEHMGPPVDRAELGLLVGSSVAPFG